MSFATELEAMQAIEAVEARIRDDLDAVFSSLRRLQAENGALLKERDEARRDHCNVLLLVAGTRYKTAYEVAVRYYATAQARLLFPPKEDKI